MLFYVCTKGLAYVLDLAQGNCTISPIANSSFDVGGSSGNANYVVKMKSPLDLFYLNGSYKYAGQVGSVLMWIKYMVKPNGKKAFKII